MKPYYKIIADDIRYKIANGELKPGDALPTTNAIAVEYGVSYGSVRGAMLILKAEGYIVGQPGVAVRVAQR